MTRIKESRRKKKEKENHPFISKKAIRCPFKRCSWGFQEKLSTATLSARVTRRHGAIYVAAGNRLEWIE